MPEPRASCGKEDADPDGIATTGAIFEGKPIMWRNLAAAKGNEIAKNARDALEKEMTPAQITEAQKLSREGSGLAMHGVGGTGLLRQFR
jgi:hypothetical protein